MKLNLKMKTIFLLIAIFAFSFFIFDFSFPAFAVTCPDTTNWDNSTGVCIPKNTGLPEPADPDNRGPLFIVIKNFMLWILGIVGMVGVIGFVIAGVFYMTAAGDDGRMEAGKNSMKWSIIGVVVALMGFIIIQAINSLLSGSSTIF